jgi:hypothetical protein
LKLQTVPADRILIWLALGHWKIALDNLGFIGADNCGLLIGSCVESITGSGLWQLAAFLLSSLWFLSAWVTFPFVLPQECKRIVTWEQTFTNEDAVDQYTYLSHWNELNFIAVGLYLFFMLEFVKMDLGRERSPATRGL